MHSTRLRRPRRLARDVESKWPRTAAVRWRPCGCCARLARPRSSAAGRPCSSSTTRSSPRRTRCATRSATSLVCGAWRICAAWRPDATGYRDPAVATRLSLKSLARRVLALNDEIAKLDRFIAPLVKELAPDLLKLEGVGFASAGELLVTAGENPDRLRSRSKLRDVVRRLPAPRLKREDATPPPQSRWEPPSQLRPAHDRRVPDAHRPANPRRFFTCSGGRLVQRVGHRGRDRGLRDGSRWRSQSVPGCGSRGCVP